MIKIIIINYIKEVWLVGMRVCEREGELLNHSAYYIEVGGNKTAVTYWS